MELKELKSKLFKRLEFGDDADGKKHKRYYDLHVEDINKKYPDEGWRIPEGYINDMKSLKLSKLYKIRQLLNDDEGFDALKSELPNIKANKERKTAELEKRIPPENPKLLQKLYTGLLGKTNTADAKINEFNKKTEEIQIEINDLTKIINDIETLIPVYEYKSSVKALHAFGDVTRYHEARKRNETNTKYYDNLNPEKVARREEEEAARQEEKRKDARRKLEEERNEVSNNNDDSVLTNPLGKKMTYGDGINNEQKEARSGNPLFWGGKRKSKKSKKSKKGKRSRKARKSRRKSARRRGRR